MGRFATVENDKSSKLLFNISITTLIVVYKTDCNDASQETNKSEIDIVCISNVENLKSLSSSASIITL